MNSAWKVRAPFVRRREFPLSTVQQLIVANFFLFTYSILNKSNILIVELDNMYLSLLFFWQRRFVIWCKLRRNSDCRLIIIYLFPRIYFVLVARLHNEIVFVVSSIFILTLEAFFIHSEI